MAYKSMDRTFRLGGLLPLFCTGLVLVLSGYGVLLVPLGEAVQVPRV